MTFAPMLAEPSKTIGRTPEEALRVLHDTGDYLFEPKWDGVRCLAMVEDGHVGLVNRNGVNVTDRYPDVVLALSTQYPSGQIVFDGEIIALGKDGRPDFNRLAKRDRQTSVQGAEKMAKSVPVIYVAFDVLGVDGKMLDDTALIGRYEILKAEAEGWPQDKLWLSPASSDGMSMWAVVEEHQLEGLIAKDKVSRYIQGRSSHWVKIKVTHSVSCVVTDWEEGKGSRAGKVGALILSVYKGGELVPIGKAGTGFDGKTLATAKNLLDTGEPFVIEVEYANFTKDGRLRFPSFKGFRSDVKPEDCTYEQLEQQR